MNHSSPLRQFRVTRNATRIAFALLTVALLAVALTTLLTAGAHAQSGTTYTVTSTADTDGYCPADNDPVTQPCTLRQVISQVNASFPGTPPDVVFAIPGAGPHVINVGSTLTVTAFIQINGATDPDGDIILDGGGGDYDGLVFDGIDAFEGIGGGVDGLTIRNFGRDGLKYNQQRYHGTTIFSNLVVENNLGNGISFIAINDAQVTRSTISGNGGHGVLIGFIDGDTTNSSSSITVNGNTITGNGGSGVVIQASNYNLVSGNTIQSNNDNGVEIYGNAYYTGYLPSTFNTVTNTTIISNEGDGIAVYDTEGAEGVYSSFNRLDGNVIVANGDQAIDLNDDGKTPNDHGDFDDGANGLLNTPVIVRTVTTGTVSYVDAYLDTVSNSSIEVEFLVTDHCDSGAGQVVHGDPYVNTVDDNGRAYFRAKLPATFARGKAVRALASNSESNTSEYSECAIVSAGNDAWPVALSMSVPADQAVSASPNEGDAIAEPDGTVRVSQYIDSLGQSRWYRFKILPHSQLIVTLTNVPANYDLTLYKDIPAEYAKIANPETLEDLTRLQADVAPSAFAPSAFAPSAFAPSAFAPSAFAPSAFAPSAFAPSAFAPSAFAPSAFAPSAFSPDAYAPSSYSAWAFDPMAFDPGDFSTSKFQPAFFDPAAFAGAQTRSLLGVSAFEGTSEEGLFMNTWLNDGWFYIRVRGRDGAFDPLNPFTLTVQMTSIPCSTAFVSPLPDTSINPGSDNHASIFVYDSSRLKAVYGNAKFNALMDKLNDTALRSEVNGTLVDVSTDARVAAANLRADQFAPCPYGKNIVAESIKSVIDRYRAVNAGLQYVVIVGGDNSIPFYRYPDNALLGPESDYYPPVMDTTAAQAGLRLNFVLSQDFYGSSSSISLNGTDMPLPDLAVGRLVETPDDIIAYLTAYAATNGGVAPAPTSAFITGYDFLADVATSVKRELTAGLGNGATVNSLITPREISPDDPRSWTAYQLDSALDARRYDLMFLAGHFASNNALAADFKTAYLTSDLMASPTNMKNVLVYSVGCHSGYNLQNEDGIPQLTDTLDFPSTFARKGATLVAGTGFQYGDTEFIEYSERLYLEFTKMLRVGSGPVPVGKALVQAKQRYIGQTAEMKGIHEKTLLEATVFGLPMFSINLPAAGRTSLSGRTSMFQTVYSPPDTVSELPGVEMGLRSADISVSPVVTEVTTVLKNVNNNTNVTASYLRGRDGVLTRPTEPTLPIEGYNVSVDGSVLRGVGWRGGQYCDAQNIIPLTGAPATEIRGVHTPFYSDVWFPLQPWSVNYYDAFGGAPGAWGSRLYVMPAQHKSMSPGSMQSVRRTWSRLDFRVYYSAFTDTMPDGSEPALADAPTIVKVSAGPNEGDPSLVDFLVRVVGNPAAGVDSVWIVYTTDPGPCGEWHALDLGQQGDDTTKWGGQLDADANAVRFVALAANGVGVVGISNNMGAYYGGMPAPATRTPTSIVLGAPSSTTGAYGASVRLLATLKDGSGQPIKGKNVTIALGSQQQVALTDSNGDAQVTLSLLLRPGKYRIRAWFTGDSTYEPSSKNSADLFTVSQQASVVTVEQVEVSASAAPPGIEAYAATSSAATKQLLVTLTDAGGRRLLQQQVFFAITLNGKTQKYTLTTNQVGEATSQPFTLPDDSYKAVVQYMGTESYKGTTTTESFTVAPLPIHLPVIRKIQR